MRTTTFGKGLVLSLALLVPGIAVGQEKTIVEIAAGNKDFSKLVLALKTAGLVEALSGEGPFTVFAPTDAAFDALGKETLNAVLADKQKLTGILTYHVISGKVPAATAVALGKDGKSAKTLNGAEVKLSIKDGSLYLNGDVKVVATDIVGKNGVIHVIDKVLLPPATPTKTSAIDRIEQSVERGVALYNAGHHRECAVTYHATVQDLLRMHGGQMSVSARQRLQHAAASVNLCGQPTESAWALRHALDEAYGQMQPIRRAAR